MSGVGSTYRILKYATIGAIHTVEIKKLIKMSKYLHHLNPLNNVFFYDTRTKTIPTGKIGDVKQQLRKNHPGNKTLLYIFFYKYLKIIGNDKYFSTQLLSDKAKKFKEFLDKKTEINFAHYIVYFADEEGNIHFYSIHNNVFYTLPQYNRVFRKNGGFYELSDNVIDLNSKCLSVEFLELRAKLMNMEMSRKHFDGTAKDYNNIDEFKTRIGVRKSLILLNLEKICQILHYHFCGVNGLYNSFKPELLDLSICGNLHFEYSHRHHYTKLGPFKVLSVEHRDKFRLFPKIHYRVNGNLEILAAQELFKKNHKPVNLNTLTRVLTTKKYLDLWKEKTQKLISEREQEKQTLNKMIDEEKQKEDSYIETIKKDKDFTKQLEGYLQQKINEYKDETIIDEKIPGNITTAIETDLQSNPQTPSEQKKATVDMLHNLESRQSLSSQTSSIDFEDKPMDLSIPPESNDFDDSYVNYLTSNYQELIDIEEQYEDDFYLGMEKETPALPSVIQSNSDPDYIKIVNFKQIMDLILRSSAQGFKDKTEEMSLATRILIYELAFRYLNKNTINDVSTKHIINDKVESLKKSLGMAAPESFYFEEINNAISSISTNKTLSTDDDKYDLEELNKELEKKLDDIIIKEQNKTKGGGEIQEGGGGGFKMFSKKIDDMQQKTYKLTYEDLEYGFTNKDIFKDKETEYKDIINQIQYILNYTGGKFEAKPFSPLRLNTLYKNRRNIIIRNTSQYIIETARFSQNNFYYPKQWKGIANTTTSPYILMFNIANSANKRKGVGHFGGGNKNEIGKKLNSKKLINKNKINKIRSKKNIIRL